LFLYNRKKVGTMQKERTKKKGERTCHTQEGKGTNKTRNCLKVYQGASSIGEKKRGGGLIGEVGKKKSPSDRK